MKTTSLLVATILVVLALPPPGTAQVDLGGHVLYTPEPAGLDGVDGAFGAGVRLGFRLPLASVGVHGAFDFFFPDCGAGECDLWTGGVNLTADLPLGDRLTPYGGAGIVFQKLDLEGATVDDTGAAFLGGVRVGGSLPVTLLGEVRYQLMDDLDDQLVVAAGLVF